MGFGKDGKGVIIKAVASITVGALAQFDVVKSAGPVITEDFRMIKTVLQAAIVGVTAAESPYLVLGIANNKLTAAEIEGSIEAAGPLHRSDHILQEAAERYTKDLAMTERMDPADTEGRFVGRDGGPIIEETIRWTFDAPAGGWCHWLYNLGDGLTTGATVTVKSTHYGVWIQ